MRLLILFCLFVPLAAQADLFKCVDNAGKVTYTNLPCSKMGLTETKVIPPPPPVTRQAKPAAVMAEKPTNDGAVTERGTNPKKKKEKSVQTAHPQESNRKKCTQLKEKMGQIMDQMDAARRQGYTAKQEAAWDTRLRELQAEKNRLGCF